MAIMVEGIVTDDNIGAELNICWPKIVNPEVNTTWER